MAGIAALVVLLVLAPPLINANRYRNQIARSMSGSLGRPVHLDNVSLHLLPTPGFTLQNLVVSEDPSFGAEPTIRANTVEATLRISSLWHRPVEFSTVRFIEPSVNLVRNAEGHWNLAHVLLQASRVETAPTGQRRAGPAPRFPYIEATGGRVNVKYGDEKLPFSLTDADFALWLPSPQQWRVRLVGRPARTDTYITESGTLRFEGELKRASSAAEIPVNFTGSWHDAPLGEASHLVTGNDMGWRGSLNVDMTLSGLLGNAELATKVTIGSLRRADFVPSRPVDVQITCSSALAIQVVTLQHLACDLPVSAPEPLALRAETVDLQRPQNASLTIQAETVPVRYGVLWAALFSPRVPVDLRPPGTIDVDLVRGAQVPPNASPFRARRSHASPRTSVDLPLRSSAWSGEIRLTLPAAASTGTGSAALPAQNSTTTVLVWRLENGANLPTLRLQPVQVRLGQGGTLNLAGAITEGGYSVTASGTASPAALLEPARYLPQLGDGLETVLPFPPTGIEPTRVEFTCGRSWSAPQTCAGPHPVGTNGRPLVIGSGSQQPAQTQPSPQRPSLLTPRNLSPLEQAPFSTPRGAPAPRAVSPQR